MTESLRDIVVASFPAPSPGGLTITSPFETLCHCRTKPCGQNTPSRSLLFFYGRELVTVERREGRPHPTFLSRRGKSGRRPLVEGGVLSIGGVWWRIKRRRGAYSEHVVDVPSRVRTHGEETWGGWVHSSSPSGPGLPDVSYHLKIQLKTIPRQEREARGNRRDADDATSGLLLPIGKR